MEWGKGGQTHQLVLQGLQDWGKDFWIPATCRHSVSASRTLGSHSYKPTTFITSILQTDSGWTQVVTKAPDLDLRCSCLT